METEKTQTEETQNTEALAEAIKTGEDVETKDDISTEVSDAGAKLDEALNSEETDSTDEGKEDKESKETDSGKEDKSADVKSQKADTSKAEEQSKETDSGKTDEKAKDSGIDESLIALAQGAGLTREQAESFSSTKDLANAISLREVFAPTKKTETKTTEEDKPYDCGLDPEKYDEKVIAALNKVGEENRELHKRLATAEAKTVESEKTQQAQLDTQYVTWLDKQITVLGEEFEDVLGKGGKSDIKEDSEFYKNRAALDDQIYILQNGYRAAGKKLPPLAELFTMAVNSCFPNKIKQSVTDKVVEKVTKRSKQTIGRGSGRENAATGAAVIKEANKKLDDALNEDD